MCRSLCVSVERGVDCNPDDLCVTESISDPFRKGDLSVFGGHRRSTEHIFPWSKPSRRAFSSKPFSASSDQHPLLGAIGRY